MRGILCFGPAFVCCRYDCNLKGMIDKCVFTDILD